MRPFSIALEERFSNRVFSISALIDVGGAASAAMTTTAYTVTSFHKVAVRWAVNNFSLWVDGTKVVEDLIGAIFAASTLSALNFHSGSGTSNYYSKTKQLQVLDYLDDNAMISLTTP